MASTSVAAFAVTYIAANMTTGGAQNTARRNMAVLVAPGPRYATSSISYNRPLCLLLTRLLYSAMVAIVGVSAPE